MPELVKKFGSKAILVFQGTNCMNQAFMEDYLNCIIREPMFTPHRLLVWDSFKCHVSSKDTKHSLKSLKQIKLSSQVVALVPSRHQMSAGINPLKTATQNHIMTGMRLESKNLQQQAILKLLFWR